MVWVVRLCFNPCWQSLANSLDRTSLSELAFCDEVSTGKELAARNRKDGTKAPCSQEGLCRKVGSPDRNVNRAGSLAKLALENALLVEILPLNGRFDVELNLRVVREVLHRGRAISCSPLISSPCKVVLGSKREGFLQEWVLMT